MPAETKCQRPAWPHSDRMTPYLLQLPIRLAAGLAGLDTAERDRHERFLRSRQMLDGGFSGREPGSDLYYTGFAVRALAILGRLRDDEPALVSYLESMRGVDHGVIDLVSWLYSALAIQVAGGRSLVPDDADTWANTLTRTLEEFRTKDGGYAKTREGAAGSTYHSFLVALCYEVLGKAIPEPERLVAFLLARQRDDGGFVEIGPMRRSGTNPTAAAVALLRMLDALSDDIQQDVSDFLAEVRSDEGGFRANDRIPFADSLSTFTGLLTAQELGLAELVPTAKVRQFIQSLEAPSGGFRGASWDVEADVEYTFYALGTLGLLGG